MFNKPLPSNGHLQGITYVKGSHNIGQYTVCLQIGKDMSFNSIDVFNTRECREGSTQREEDIYRICMRALSTAERIGCSNQTQDSVPAVVHLAVHSAGLGLGDETSTAQTSSCRIC
jgi:hypothetical protein